MCTGLEIAAIASTAAQVGGSFLQTQQANKNAQSKINARNAALSQEQERQRAFQAANDTSLNNTLDAFSKDKQEQSFGDLVAKREQAYESNAPAAAEFANISDTTPQVVKTDLAKRVAGKMAESKAQAKALARIGGTMDVFQNNGLSINQAANQIGTTNSMARGSLDTNRVEQQAAYNNAGNKSSMFGDLLSAAGAAGGLYSAVNGGYDALGDRVLKGTGVRKTATLPAGVQGPVGTYDDWGALSPF